MTGRVARLNLLLLYLMEVCSGLSRGSYLVCIGWTTLVVTDDVGRVGQVFIIAMLTTLLSGPFVGTIVDRHNRAKLVILSHLGIALVLGFLAFVWLARPEPSIGKLFCAIAAASALRMLHNSAHDGLLQATVGKTEIIATLARFRGLHLIFTAVGTVLVGFVIEWTSPSMGFVFSAGASLVLILPMAFVRNNPINKNSSRSAEFIADLKSSATIFLSNRSLRLLALLAAVSLPIGQLSNAILSSLIRDDLSKGSDAFGIVDAAWPLGGMLAAGLLATGLRGLSGRNMEYVFALLAGISTIGLSLCTTVPFLVLAHGAMGLTVWLCRIVIDGRVLEICLEENVGRTKAGIEMAFSFSALVMCFSPTLVKLSNTASYFLFWGGAMVLVSCLIWILDRARSGDPVQRKK